MNKDLRRVVAGTFLAFAMAACSGSTVEPTPNTSDAASASDAAAPGTKGAGESCVNGSECVTGECLPFAMFPADGGACTTIGTYCSITCTTDAECQSLGANSMCFATCGATMSCGPTG